MLDLVSRGPPSGYYILLISRKPLSGYDIFLISRRPPSGYNSFLISRRPPSGYDISLISRRPPSGYNIFLLSRRLPSGYDIFLISRRPPSGYDIFLVYVFSEEYRTVPPLRLRSGIKHQSTTASCAAKVATQESNWGEHYMPRHNMRHIEGRARMKVNIGPHLAIWLNINLSYLAGPLKLPKTTRNHFKPPEATIDHRKPHGTI